MFDFFDWLKIGLGGIAGAALVSAPIDFYGKAIERADVLSRMKDDRITILQDGKKIDEDVLASDDAALCGFIGGCLPDKGGSLTRAMFWCGSTLRRQRTATLSQMIGAPPCRSLGIAGAFSATAAVNKDCWQGGWSGQRNTAHARRAARGAEAPRVRIGLINEN